MYISVIKSYPKDWTRLTDFCLFGSSTYSDLHKADALFVNICILFNDAFGKVSSPKKVNLDSRDVNLRAREPKHQTFRL